MKTHIRLLAASMLVLAVTQLAAAQVPGGIDVVCDVDRTQFRAAVTGQSQACFQLWTQEAGGTMVGTAHCVPLGAITATRVRTDSFAGQRTRTFMHLTGVIGTDDDPVELPPDDEAWLDLTIGSRVLGCDFVSGTPSRRRLESTLFARRAPGSASVPTGSIMPFAGAVVPTGWLPCDGSTFSRIDYAALYSVIGTSYGNGNGSTTANLPDLRGRIAVGRGTSPDVDALGDSDGQALASRTPMHSHAVADHAHAIPPHQHTVDIWSSSEVFDQFFSDCSRRYPKVNFDCFGHKHAINGLTGVTGLTTLGATAAIGTSAQAPSFLTVNYIIKY